MINPLLTATGDKPDRVEALNVLLALAERHPESVEELKKLYLFFKPKPLKGMRAASTRVERWLALVVNPEDHRDYLRNLYSDGTHVYGSDGHQIHMAVLNWPRGYYDPVTFHMVRNCDGRFPVDRVLDMLAAHQQWWKGVTKEVQSHQADTRVLAVAGARVDEKRFESMTVLKGEALYSVAENTLAVVIQHPRGQYETVTAWGLLARMRS